MIVLEPIVRVEGPPPGLAQGRYEVPRWGIGLVGALIVLFGFAYLVNRWVRRRKAKI